MFALVSSILNMVIKVVSYLDFEYNKDEMEEGDDVWSTNRKAEEASVRYDAT